MKSIIRSDTGIFLHHHHHRFPFTGPQHVLDNHLILVLWPSLNQTIEWFNLQLQISAGKSIHHEISYLKAEPLSLLGQTGFRIHIPILRIKPLRKILIRIQKLKNTDPDPKIENYRSGSENREKKNCFDHRVAFGSGSDY